MPAAKSVASIKAKRSADLLVALRRCNWSRVQALLEEGADVNACGAHKVTPLMMAASKAKVEVCLSLLAHHARPDARDEQNKRTALMYACACPETSVADVMQTLMDGGAAVDLQDANGRSGLMLAAEAGNGTAVMFLLEHGANVFLVAQNGSLDHKSMGLHGNVARRFLHNVTERPTNAVDNYMYVRRLEDEREELDALEELERLAEETEEWVVQVDPNELQEGDALVIDEHISDDVRRRSDTDNVLSQPSDDEDQEDQDDWLYADMLPGGTFLSRVAPLRPQDLAKPPLDPEMHQKLIAQSEKLRGVTRRPAGAGDTALTIAARGGHADICELLLHFNADSNAADGNGETALGVAARRGHVEACRALLSRHPSRQSHAAAVKAADEAGCESVARVLRGYDV